MSRRSAFAAMCIAATVGGLTVGCDTTEQGSPTTQTAQRSTSIPPPGSTSSTAVTPLPFAGAPAVVNPLDASKFLDDPCLALTSVQITQLNVGAGKKSKAYLGMACDWANPDTGGSVNLQFLARFREGLSAVYRANDEDKYATFNPIDDLAGFPAVIAEPSSEPNDMCTMYIGVSDDLAMQLAVVESRDKVGQVDPCEVAKAVAPLVLQTMKAGA
jgi:uncharacterized protein DUF3558